MLLKILFEVKYSSIIAVIYSISGSFVRNVVAHWLEMWWLSGWRCGGSLVGDVVAHWLDM